MTALVNILDILLGDGKTLQSKSPRATLCKLAIAKARSVVNSCEKIYSFPVKGYGQELHGPNSP